MESLEQITIIDDFCVHLKDEGESSNSTVKCYRTDLIQFAEFIAAKPQQPVDENTATSNASAASVITQKIVEADKNDLQNFITHLKDVRKNSIATIHRKIYSLKSFYRWCYRSKLSADDPTNAIKGPRWRKSVPRTVPVEEVEKLIDMPDNTSLLGMRDEALIGTLFATGICLGELININIEDVDVDVEKTIKIRGRTPRKKDRVLPLDQATVVSIKQFMESTRADTRYSRAWDNDLPKKPLFFNKHGGRLSSRSVHRLLVKYSKLAGFERPISPRTIRHSYAIHALQNGADLRQMQRDLGHRSPATTSIYGRMCRSNQPGPSSNPGMAVAS